MSITNYETLISNAYRRSIRLGEGRITPRVTDLPYLVASFTGKIELETFEEGRESKIMEELSKKAVLNVFGRYFDVSSLESIIQAFNEGAEVETSSELPSSAYLQAVKEVDGLDGAVKRLGVGNRPEAIASAAEFILEGLHLNRKLNCSRSEKGLRYSQQ